MEYLTANRVESVSSGLISDSISLIAFWSFPPDDFQKVNVDAAWNVCPPSTGFGVVCRDSRGMMKGASASFVDLDFSPTIAVLYVIIKDLN